MHELVLLGWGKQELCKYGHGKEAVELRCYFCKRSRSDGTARVVDDEVKLMPLVLERFVLKLLGAQVTCVICRDCKLVHQMVSLQECDAADAMEPARTGG